ncbi:unnamed protein product [Gongylonema pulchrum]|uniref:Uncharacterized protein n=1 Tax=Gongylonema pulchrum TaxID=637853 RepID=A0A183EX10_9BILA|nr:unnamed protein product [Gongylonema pulchrum]
MENQDLTERQESMHRLVQHRIPIFALTAQQAHQAQQDHRDQKAHLVQLDLQAPVENLRCLDHLDLLDRQEMLVLPDRPGRVDHQAHQERLLKQPAHQDLLDQPAHEDHRDQWDRKGLAVKLALLVHRVHQAIMEKMVLRVSQEDQVHRVWLDNRAPRVVVTIAHLREHLLDTENIFCLLIRIFLAPFIHIGCLSFI